MTDLSGRLGASAATVRRDLLKLEGDGLLTRVHGGAVIEEDAAPFAEAAEAHVPAKDAIAAQAATMIEDDQSIILDSGTTVHRLARRLRGRRITVITNNLVVYEELVQDESVELMLLGGMVIRESRMGACCVRVGGQVMDTTVAEVPARRAMIAAGDKVALLVDSTKFPGMGMVKICGAEDLDVVVTDASSDATTCMALEEAGVQVVRVNVGRA